MLQITLTHFTPAQAEKITGMAVDQQRNLRRHGYLPQSSGHSRYDGFALARMDAIQSLAARGIGPSLTAKPENGFDIATLCATGILWSLLGWSDAYEGDHLTFVQDGPPPVSFSPEEKRMVVDAAIARGMSEEEANHLISEGTRDWASRSDTLRRQVMTLMPIRRLIPARYFIWWADGSHSWEVDLDEAFSGSHHDPRVQGAAVVIDQDAIASRLLSRAGSAFAHVEERNQ